MKSFRYMSNEDKLKLISTFRDKKEVNEFVKLVQNLSEEITFNIMLSRRLSKKEAQSIELDQVAIIAFFFRDNMDVIVDLVRNLEYKMVTNKELMKLIEEQDKV